MPAMPVSSVSAIDRGGDAFVAADDVVRAGERSFRIGGVSRRHASPVNVGEKLADAAAHVGVVAVLRNEHEDRDEAVERVDAGERPDARVLGQPQDVDGEPEQRRLVDLKQFVAGVAFEHVQERPSGVARRIEPGLGHDPRHLGANVRDVAAGVGVGARGEQADEAQFSFEQSVVRKQLDADVVEVRPPVHPRLHVRFRDDERLRLGQEGPHLRGHHDEVAPAAQNAHGRVAQEAEARLRHRVGGHVALREAVFPDAEKGEIAVGQPFQKSGRFGRLVGRERRRS